MTRLAPKKRLNGRQYATEPAKRDPMTRESQRATANHTQDKGWTPKLGDIWPREP